VAAQQLWFCRCSVYYRHLVAAGSFKCRQPRVLFSMPHKPINSLNDKLPGVFIQLVKKSSPCMETVGSSPYWQLHCVIPLRHLLKCHPTSAFLLWKTQSQCWTYFLSAACVLHVPTKPSWLNSPINMRNVSKGFLRRLRSALSNGLGCWFHLMTEAEPASETSCVL
jgi:hypothetical protein